MCETHWARFQCTVQLFKFHYFFVVVVVVQFAVLSNKEPNSKIHKLQTANDTFFWGDTLNSVATQCIMSKFI